jgi:phosphate/sulfate permease
MEKYFLKLPLSTQMAIVSFIIGTILFAGFFIVNDKMQMVAIGYNFIIISLIINSLILLKLIYDWFKNPLKKKIILKQIFILLANIPIAYIYFLILYYSVTSNSPYKF